jgi:hypothetical protein
MTVLLYFSFVWLAQAVKVCAGRGMGRRGGAILRLRDRGSAAVPKGLEKPQDFKNER